MVRSHSLLFLALVAWAACSSEPTMQGEYRPIFSVISPGQSCTYFGDFADTLNDSLLMNACQLADDGFANELAVFQLYDYQLHSTELQDTLVYFVLEQRFTASGRGNHIATATFFPDGTTGPITTEPFGVTLFEELTFVRLIGTSGGCPRSYSDPRACAKHALLNGYFHDEPRLCVSNGSCLVSNDPVSQNDNWAPTAEFAAEEVSRTDSSAMWRFDAGESEDHEAGPLTYSWSFSDGSDTVTSADTVRHLFQGLAGTHWARLAVLDTSGGFDAIVESFNVGFIGAPIAAFNYLCTNLGCSFTNLSSDSSGSGLSSTRLWDFGDSQTSTSLNPSHTYDLVGSYAVRLKVFNGNGDSAIAEREVQLITAAITSTNIDGNDNQYIAPNQTCTWFGSHEGTGTSFTYQWSRKLPFQYVGTGLNYTGSVGTQTFMVGLEVRRASGPDTASIKGFKLVKVIPTTGEPTCP